MKTSTMMWIAGGVAVWYFFLRNKGTTGQATSASTVADPATSGPAASGPAVAYQLDEPDIAYYGPTWSWAPGWGSGYRSGWGGGGVRHHHRGGGGGGGHRGRH